ncbi:YhcH/YjgK/YiaL family protein [Paenibacillus sp. LHD-38]|uniref:YhcH/YjgK/YiaL family protein n=1 Tax=Paenibacillus sp. LHD-38 TaxID=3072143 RepID=UPI00280D03BC|nr:YhcH/YjgK/YiaL family protein [Paenibacillus sp. LHD-38]MDQ8735163.1 YhcH/YjgK/YiaL family protein [Paenibacillus sp. LHD-38]
MIYDKISNAGQYAFENHRLKSAVEDMRLNLHGEADETNDFQKNSIVFTTVSKEEKRYEAHRKFIDIHIVLEGQEYVEVSNVECLSNSTAYDPDRDIHFGDVTSSLKFKGCLEPGYFLICFPEDTHLVGAHEQAEQVVKKIIYKIAV